MSLGEGNFANAIEQVLMKADVFIMKPLKGEWNFFHFHFQTSESKTKSWCVGMALLIILGFLGLRTTCAFVKRPPLTAPVYYCRLPISGLLSVDVDYIKEDP